MRGWRKSAERLTECARRLCLGCSDGPAGESTCPKRHAWINERPRFRVAVRVLPYAATTAATGAEATFSSAGFDGKEGNEDDVTNWQANK